MLEIEENSQYTGLRINNTSTGGGYWDILSNGNTSVNSDALSFWNGSHRLLIDDNGNIGIGTTIPLQKLDVDGQIRMRTGGSVGYIPVSDADGVMTWTDPAAISTANDHDWYISNTTNSPSSINDNIYTEGKVGIGLTTPITALHLRNDPGISFSSVTNSGTNLATDWNKVSQFKIDQADGSGNALAFFVSGQSNERKTFIQSGHTQGNFSNVLGAISLNPFGGNVGVGVDPSTTFHVASDNNPEIRVQEQGQDGYLNLVGFAATQGWIYQIDNVDDEAVMLDIDAISTTTSGVTTGAQNIRLFRNSNASNDISSNFAIHIPGSTTQSLVHNAKLGRLTINGQSKTNSDIVVYKEIGNSIGRTGMYLDLDNSTNDAEARISLERTASTDFLGLEIYSNANHGIRFSTVDGSSVLTERVRFKKTGEVQILDLATGTGNPDLVVVADEDGVLSTVAGTTFGDNLGDHTATQNIVLAGSWISNDGDNEGINISDAGDVGIGVAPNASYKLFVHGKIKTTGITELSDVRYKKNILSLNGSLEKVKQLRGVTYEWKNSTQFNNREGLQSGLIAQEVELVIPSVVDTDLDGFKSVQYSHLAPYLIEAIKELNAKIEELEIANSKKGQEIQLLRSEVNQSSFDNKELKLMLIQLYDKLGLEFDANGKVISLNK